jgi:predicted GH43/DUF377 family glycosyl hydrolase
MTATTLIARRPTVTHRVELFTRCAANPLLTAADWPYPTGTVTNPAAARVNGETLLVCHVEDRYGISHLHVARSADGITNWRVDETPLIAPDPDGVSTYGAQDPRVTFVPELDRWIIVYTAVGRPGPCVALASTDDFRHVEHLGVAMLPDNKDGCLLARRVNGRYILLHRPTSPMTGRADVWLSHSADLRSWSTPQPVLAARTGQAWDSARVGMGPPPIETPAGWLGVYHGVRQLAAGPICRAGLVLLDLDQPERVLRRSHGWVLTPTLPYERIGDVPNMVFPSGLIHDPATDELRLYYGAAGTGTAMASARLTDVLAHILSDPHDHAAT